MEHLKMQHLQVGAAWKIKAYHQYWKRLDVDR